MRRRQRGWRIGLRDDATSPTCGAVQRGAVPAYASARGPFASAAEMEAWLSAVSCAKRYETVAVLAGRTIGFAGLYVMGEGLEHSGWVLIGVREGFQARGVGARLLKMLIGAATVVFGLRRVQLTVFGDNDPAIKSTAASVSRSKVATAIHPPRRRLRRRLHHGEAQSAAVQRPSAAA